MIPKYEKRILNEDIEKRVKGRFYGKLWIVLFQKGQYYIRGDESDFGKEKMNNEKGIMGAIKR